MLWGALFSPLASSAPANCLWTKQVAEPLTWILAFLRWENGSVIRVFHCLQYFNRGEQVNLYFDASTTGFGCWMQLGDKAIKWMSGTFNNIDTKMLQIVNEDSKAQQAFEAMALLIMLRQWYDFLAEWRFTVRVRGDNLAALSLLSKMQPKSPSLALVARELSLVISSGSFSPNFAEHLPGVSNTVADTLSRKSELGVSFKLPSILEGVEETVPDERDQDWWLTQRAS